MYNHNMKVGNIVIFFLVVLFFCNNKYAVQLDTRTRIAIIDTGVYPIYINPSKICGGKIEIGMLDFSDLNHHGSYIYNIIAEKIDTKSQCILIYNAFNDNAEDGDISKGVLYAIKNNAKIINISLAGKGFNKNEFLAIHKATTSGIKFFVASGNSGLNLNKKCNIYPACYGYLLRKNFTVVGSNNYKGGNRGDVVNLYLSGHYNKKVGTSFSAAYATRNEIRRLNAKKLEKH